ncbi:hypothetical protein D3C75_945930 [compost metagenome]
MVVALAEEAVDAAVQLAVGIVLVGCQSDPSVFIQIEAALGVNVPCPRFERRLDHPHPMFFPTNELGGQMVGGHYRFQIALVRHTVSVVRNDHFLFAHQFPVIAIQRTVEHKGVVPR